MSFCLFLEQLKNMSQEDSEMKENDSRKSNFFEEDDELDISTDADFMSVLPGDNNV